MLVRMYVSKPNKVDRPKSMQQEANSLELMLALEFGGWTKTEDTIGAWVNEDEIHMDKTDVYEILITDYDHNHEAKIKEFVQNFGKIYKQECLPFAVMNSHNHFIQIPPHD